MLKIMLQSSSPKPGHRQIGDHYSFLAEFPAKPKSCTINDIYNFLIDRINAYNQRNNDGLSVSKVQLRQLMSRALSSEHRIIDGRTVGFYESSDVIQFGNLVQNGNRYVVD